MPEIIQEWLGTCLGVILDITPENFGKNVKDGKILAKLLHSYDILSADFVGSLNDSAETKECFENLLRLKPWLDYFGVESDRDTLEGMAEGQGSAALRVFYSLYASLGSKDKLHFTSRQKERKAFDDTIHLAYKVEQVPEMKIRSSPVHYESSLSLPLIEKQPMIHWHKNNCASVIRQIHSFKENFLKLHAHKSDKKTTLFKHKSSAGLSKTNEIEASRREIEQFMSKHVVHQPNLTYNELKNLEQNILSLPPGKMDVSQAQDYINFLKQRSRKKITNRTFQQKMQTLLLDELWKKILDGEEKRIDQNVADIVLKQSQYEKQMCSKLSLIKHQKKKLAENRRLVEDFIMKSHERDFDEGLNLKLSSQTADAQQEEMERTRLQELHKRLYMEKVRLRYEQNLTEARAIVYSLADIAVRCAEYRALNECKVPEKLMKEMKELFFHNLPIFDVLERLESLVEEETGEEGEVESIMDLEMERQDILDETCLNDYIYLLGPWMVELLFPDGVETEQYPSVLGYVVHKLLLVKYPLPPSPVPADIKPMEPKTILIGLSDANGIDMLCDLLETRHILVVKINDVINFILHEYQKELAVVRDIDITFGKATKAALRGIKKKEKKPIEKKKEKLSAKDKVKKDKKKKETAGEEPLSKQVETQTPRKIPDDDPLLSPNAELGKMAFEALGLGDKVPDFVLVSAIIAYVCAHQEEHSGWVLVNFPEFYFQAKEMECLLTGYSLLPVEENMNTVEALEGYECRGREVEGNRDPYQTLRESRIVPNTIPVLPSVEPKSYFTAFINSKKQSAQPSAEKELTPLESFYLNQNIYFNFEYSAINFITMKQLAKLIIGDIEVNGDLEVVPKPSLEVFGEKLAEIEEKWSKQRKKPDRESKQRKPKSMKEVKPKPPPEEILPEPIPELEVPVEETPEKGKKEKGKKGKKVTDNGSEVEFPKPGDPDWEWVNEPQQEEIQLALATLWENMEAVYIEDFKHVFFCLRLHYSKIVCYITHIKQNIRAFMEQPDGKQALLSEFQNMFNDIDVDLRPDVEIKCELHCRVSEFQQALMDIIEERKRASEQFRCSLAREDWVPDELISLVNYYLTAVQLEADRCVDSCQVINDYYVSMQNKPLQGNYNEKIVVPRLQISSIRCSIVSRVSGSRQSSGSIKPRLDSVKCSQDGCNVIAESLINLKWPAESYTPFHSFFDETLKIVVDQISKITKTFYDVSKKDDKGKEGKKGKKGTSTVMDVGRRLVMEWISAIECEINRFIFRIKLIRERAILDMDEFLMAIFNGFSQMSDEIGELYFREVQSLGNCCKIFRCAIEEEVPIQQQLELTLDKIIVRHDVLLFQDPPLPPQPPIAERYSEFEFTLNQLSRLYYKLHNVAPEGEIPVKAFIYIMQDLRTMNSEGDGKSLPVIWDSIHPDDMTDIFRKIYQRLEIVNWKDFVIYALGLPFPTEGEILNMRHLFRAVDPQSTEMVNKEDYNGLELWFEDYTEDEQNNLRIDLAKDLLFKMYQVDETQTNYTALLLAFCKDVDPTIGFKKALALSMGKYIRLTDEGEYVESVSSDKEGWRAAEEVLEEMVADTIRETEGIMLKDYVETPEEDIKTYPCNVKSSCDYGPKISSSTIEMAAEEDYSYPVSPSKVSIIPESTLSGRLLSNSVSVIPKKVVRSILISSFPSLSQLSVLLKSERSLEVSIDVMFDGLDSVKKSIFAYKLLQHDFMFRLLTSTNKFKIIDIPACVCDVKGSPNASESDFVFQLKSQV